MMIKDVVKYFDRLENKIKSKLSHYPILYAFIGGVGVVLFWRGIWHAADDINMSSIISMIVGAFILLITGVFVSSLLEAALLYPDSLEKKN